jgi:hypothetical protein
MAGCPRRESQCLRALGVMTGRLTSSKLTCWAAGGKSSASCPRRGCARPVVYRADRRADSAAIDPLINASLRPHWHQGPRRRPSARGGWSPAMPDFRAKGRVSDVSVLRRSARDGERRTGRYTQGVAGQARGRASALRLVGIGGMEDKMVGTGAGCQPVFQRRGLPFRAAFLARNYMAAVQAGTDARRVDPLTS